MELRVLTSDDVPLARAMSRLFGRVFDDEDSYMRQPPGDDYLRRLLASDTFVAVVALVGGRVVGGLAGYMLHKFEQARSELYIYDLGVDADHRRRGIATALIERVRELAGERGAHVIYVQADHGDDPAIALYTGLGTREDVLHFDIEPRGEPPKA